MASSHSEIHRQAARTRQILRNSQHVMGISSIQHRADQRVKQRAGKVAKQAAQLQYVKKKAAAKAKPKPARGKAPKRLLTPNQALIRARYRKLLVARKALFTKPSAHTTASLEYKKELARKAFPNRTLRHLSLKGGIKADRDIARKLVAAGFTKKQVANAIAKHSPVCAKCTRGQRVDYIRKYIAPALKNRRFISKMYDFYRLKREAGLTSERRLHKLGIATPRTPKQVRSHKPLRSMSQRRKAGSVPRKPLTQKSIKQKSKEQAAQVMAVQRKRKKKPIIVQSRGRGR
ncbi:hypothetical protein Pse7367_3745 (plasmid) [Thalassoporum mexicanum PCC 7367]|uniref:hypothetical protein n=1 Tax=Thalassoporum mexicanum TaxID=3457544 RepID=UPI00029FF93F|nr:hypothetical protein [Pseudanabaena sp. PCC 7367]AFY71971.1 hypothetical protein Pse7367_3745 [Pseudanabaena sp. PCC 7367]